MPLPKERVQRLCVRFLPRKRSYVPYDEPKERFRYVYRLAETISAEKIAQIRFHFLLPADTEILLWSDLSEGKRPTSSAFLLTTRGFHSRADLTKPPEYVSWDDFKTMKISHRYKTIFHQGVIFSDGRMLACVPDEATYEPPVIELVLALSKRARAS